jgi:hypothetical protein
MKYGNGISKSKNHLAVPDDRILQFAVSLLVTPMLIDSVEQWQGEKSVKWLWLAPNRQLHSLPREETGWQQSKRKPI